MNKSINTDIVTDLKTKANDENRQSLDTIDVLKFLCTIPVLTLHVRHNNGGDFIPILSWMTGLSVGIFFFISGYFIPDRQNIIRLKRISKYVKRIAWLILLSNSAYLAFAIVTNIHHLELISKFLELDFWIDQIITGKDIAMPLWFLNAMFWALLVFYITTRFKAEKFIAILVPISLISFTISPLCGNPFWLTAISRSILWMTMGIVIRQNENYIKQHLIAVIAIGILVFSASMILPRVYSAPALTSVMNAISSCLCSTVIFLIAKNLKIKCPRFLVNLGRLHSANIYIYHSMMILVLSKILFILVPEISVLEVYVATWGLSLFLNRFLPIFSATPKNKVSRDRASCG